MQRISTSLVLGFLVLLAVFLLPDLWFLVFVIALAELAAVELARIGRTWAPDAPLHAMLVVLPLLVVLLAAGFAPYGSMDAPVRSAVSAPGLPSGLIPVGLSPETILLLVALLLGPAVVTVLLFSGTPTAQALPAVGCLSFGSLYIALPVVSCWKLQKEDPWLLVLLLVLVAAGDTAAFYFGKTFGRRKMSPLISPKKTWVGAGAGFAAAVLTTAAWCGWRIGRVDPEWIVLGAAVGIAAQLGDLAESMLKRGAGIKDSGRLLPGHGGILDRTDSLFFAAPILLLGLSLIAD